MRMVGWFGLEEILIYLIGHLNYASELIHSQFEVID